jgi:hypothetical protein
MSEPSQTEDGGVMEPGILTRLRPFAGWFIIATGIVGIAWVLFTWR